MIHEDYDGYGWITCLGSQSQTLGELRRFIDLLTVILHSASIPRLSFRKLLKFGGFARVNQIILDHKPNTKLKFELFSTNLTMSIFLAKILSFSPKLLKIVLSKSVKLVLETENDHLLINALIFAKFDHVCMF